MRSRLPLVVPGLLVGLLSSACGSSTPSTDVPAPAIVAPPLVPSLPPLLSANTLGCGVASLPDLHNTCPRLDPQYLGDVIAAVQFIQGSRPDVVEPTGRVLDHRGYTNAVVERLRAMGYCAVDQLEEIAIKKNNSFNEQYNIWTSTGSTRNSYITTCFPAQF
jgi:hypothetical protein